MPSLIREIRENSKSEARNPKQIRMTKIQNSKQKPDELHMTPMWKHFANSGPRISVRYWSSWALFWTFDIYASQFWICFEFRISCFVFSFLMPSLIRDAKGYRCRLQVKVTGEGGIIKRRQASKYRPKGASSHLQPETCTYHLKSWCPLEKKEDRKWRREEDKKFQKGPWLNP